MRTSKKAKPNKRDIKRLRKKVRKAAIEMIRHKLITDNKWLMQALFRLYNCQTNLEKDLGITIEKNYEGFNSMDSVLLSSFVVQLKEKGYLTNNQMMIVRRRLDKYANQLYEMIINERRIP
jgi:hypothetical protein